MSEYFTLSFRKPKQAKKCNNLINFAKLRT